MVVISGVLYLGVRYAPYFNKERPFQIIAVNHVGGDSYFTELNYEEAADLVKSLSLLLLTEANKDG